MYRTDLVLCGCINDLPISGNNFLKLQKEGNKMNVQINVPEDYRGC